jgi:hypothetical protein
LDGIRCQDSQGVDADLVKIFLTVAHLTILQQTGANSIGIVFSLYHDPRKSPLTLPSPARGEGFRVPSLDGRGKGEGDIRLRLQISL